MFKVYNECCKNCLLSTDRIVSGKRAKEIISDCASKQKHFECHKATMKGENICCKTFFDRFGHMSQMIRISERLGMIEYVPQEDSEKLTPYNKKNNL